MKANNELTAKIEPFDTFWEAPEDIEKGYYSFTKFYQRNYLKYLPEDKNAQILVVSCGPGYFLHLLKEAGYTSVLGIDSDPTKVKYAQKRSLNCRAEHAFSFLTHNQEVFDVIVLEQEINHLTKYEIMMLLELCWQNLVDWGTLILHSLNGANPITGSEALAQNFNHYNTFTEYSLTQILNFAKFDEIKVFPLKLFIFYENPLNYAGLFLEYLFTAFFRFSFKLYGKSNRIFAKKIGAVCQKRTELP